MKIDKTLEFMLCIITNRNHGLGFQYPARPQRRSFFRNSTFRRTREKNLWHQVPINLTVPEKLMLKIVSIIGLCNISITCYLLIE